jgi:hypothetical protein
VGAKIKSKMYLQISQTSFELAFCDPPLIKLFAYKIDELAIQLFANKSKHID